MRDLSRTLELAWSEPRAGRLDRWEYRIVFSVQGPPFFELIEGPAGSPWDASGGARFDHLGYWSGDIDSDKRQLELRGAALDFDACPFGRSFAYHRLDSIGARIELVDVSAQPGFVKTWSPHAGPMSVLTLTNRSGQVSEEERD